MSRHIPLQRRGYYSHAIKKPAGPTKSQRRVMRMSPNRTQPLIQLVAKTWPTPNSLKSSLCLRTLPQLAAPIVAPLAKPPLLAAFQKPPQPPLGQTTLNNATLRHLIRRLAVPSLRS